MNLSRATLFIWIGLLLSIGFITSCQKAPTVGESPNTLTEAKLTALMAPVKSWLDFSSKGYSSNDWVNLIAAAKTIQKCDPSSVKSALRRYQLRGHPERDFDGMLSISNCIDTDSKIFLAMRAVFELPTSVKEGNLLMGGGWVPSQSLINSDHTLNQSWPVEWNNGRPSIIEGYSGMQGIYARYDACWEYEMFLKKYPLRDLSSFDQTLPPKGSGSY